MTPIGIFSALLLVGSWIAYMIVRAKQDNQIAELRRSLVRTKLLLQEARDDAERHCRSVEKWGRRERDLEAELEFLRKVCLRERVARELLIENAAGENWD